jgi:hypothetical protein
VSDDRIVLTMPPERDFYAVAHLVVGGLAARIDLSYEHLDDLQLALASVLENEHYTADAEVTVELLVREDAVAVVIGPLNGSKLRADLDRADGNGITLGRLLRTVVEAVVVEEREDGVWLRLEKHASMP